MSHNSKVSQSKPAGNTKTAGCYQQYRWQWTLKAYHSDDEPIKPETICENLKNYCLEFYFQLEEGKDGYKHYQGCLRLKHKEYLQSVKNIIGYNDVHLEQAKDWNRLKNYCKKNNTRINGPWSHETVWIETIRELNWWQQPLLEMLLEIPDKRKIYWIWDKEGNKGKSSFAKYMGVNFGATILCNGKFDDIAYSLPDNPKIIIFDIPRRLEERVNYQAIEKCKDGMVFSGKYESKMKYFNEPHVIVFSNFKPDLTALSLDRWEIINLDE